MTPRLLTPPAELPVSLQEAKDALGIDGGALDVSVTAWILGVAEFVEQYTRRALITQSWRLTGDAFPDVIRLPNSPAVSVESIKFIDAGGALQVLAPTDYLVDIESEPGRIVPGRGLAWPVTYDEINAVTVNYTCGYGSTAESVPAQIKLFILAKLREQYDPAVRMERDTVQSSFIDRLLDRAKVYG